MTYYVEHLFKCLLICHVYIFLERCLLRSLVHFLIMLLVPIMLSFKNSLHILDNSTLSDVYFTNIFSKCVSCLLNLLALSFTKQKFSIFMKFSFSIISSTDNFFQLFLLLCLWYCILKVLDILKVI